MNDLPFLYDQVLELLARLSAFCGRQEAILGDGDDSVEADVEHIGEILAKRDLLTFAASSRNFAEASQSVAKMKTHSLASVRAAPLSGEIVDGPEVTLYQALSRILHAHNVQVCTQQYSLAIFTAEDDETRRRLKEQVWELFSKPQFSPVIVVRTTQENVTAFKLDALLKASCAYLNEVVHRLAARQIFVERSLRDL